MLEGRNAVITGAASGIGRAIAVEFARLGARILIADIRETPVEGGATTVDTIRAEGGEALMLQADISKESEAERLIETAAGFGRIDIVVNNAAVALGCSITETTMEIWERTMAVNVTGPFLVSRSAMRRMRDQDVQNEARGRIINVGSQHGMIAAPEDFAYGISKAAIIHMTRQLALDGAPHKIICNAVSPGKIDTGKDGPAMAQRWIDYSLARTPLGHMGRSKDVAQAVAFFASDKAAFITGANLVVDGGWMAS